MAKRNPRFTLPQILELAAVYHERTGFWPIHSSGVIEGDGRTWEAANDALRRGYLSHLGHQSLLKLLASKFGAPKRQKPVPVLDKEHILKWADAHHELLGKWPNKESGRVLDEPRISWLIIQNYMKRGEVDEVEKILLSQLFRRERGLWRHGKSRLMVPLILEWADEHFRSTGHWPNINSGAVRMAPKEKWICLNAYLERGGRGLPKGDSLARLLKRERGVYHRQEPPELSVKQILEWADAHRARTGSWPKSKRGRVEDTTDLMWATVNARLRQGGRGLPGGTTMTKLLAEHRGVRNRYTLPTLNVPLILKHADLHHTRTGDWPTSKSGPVQGLPHTNWFIVDMALCQGCRGLAGGTTLLQLLVKQRGVIHARYAPMLIIKYILAWADAHYLQTGVFPLLRSGSIPESPGDTWSRIDSALTRQSRGIKKKTTLKKLLLKHRMPEYEQCRTPLFPDSILEWAADYHELYGWLPTHKSGPVRGMDGEHWPAIDASLQSGTRTRPGGSSLKEFLRGHYEKPWPGIGRKLTEERILKWADSFRERVGTWPTRKSAYTDPSRTERWQTIDLCLQEGHRGLPGGSSLHRLLSKHRFGGK